MVIAYIAVCSQEYHGRWRFTWGHFHLKPQEMSFLILITDHVQLIIRLMLMTGAPTLITFLLGECLPDINRSDYKDILISVI